ncbi:MAG: archaeosortase/exosortase family protein, partial [Steroidobacteraceae bacterium]
MPEYSYSLALVPFIVCWIAARSFDLPQPVARISPAAVAVLVAMLAAWLVAYKASSAIGEQLLIPFILWSAAWMAFGLPIARRLAVPIACLY